MEGRRGGGEEGRRGGGEEVKEEESITSKYCGYNQPSNIPDSQVLSAPQEDGR